MLVEHGQGETPDRPVRMLSEAGVVALRSALQGELRGAVRPVAARPDAAPHVALRSAARVLCDAALRQHLRVEQLLVLIKQAWASLPEVAQLPAGEERDELRDRLITLCIEEFYAASRSAARGD